MFRYLKDLKKNSLISHKGLLLIQSCYLEHIQQSVVSDYLPSSHRLSILYALLGIKVSIAQRCIELPNYAYKSHNVNLWIALV